MNIGTCQYIIILATNPTWSAAGIKDIPLFVLEPVKITP